MAEQTMVDRVLETLQKRFPLEFEIAVLQANNAVAAEEISALKESAAAEEEDSPEGVQQTLGI